MPATGDLALSDLAGRPDGGLGTGERTSVGAPMRFDLPGLNVVDDQPPALAQAGPTAADGWGAVRTPV